MSDRSLAGILRFAMEWHTAGLSFPPVGGDDRHEGPLTLSAIADRFIGHAGDVVLPVATAAPADVFAEVTTPVRSLSTLVDELDAAFLDTAARTAQYDPAQRRHAIVAGLHGAAQLVAREADEAFLDTVASHCDQDASLPRPDDARASADRFAQWLADVVDEDAHQTALDARDAHVEAGETALEEGEMRVALGAFRKARLLDSDDAAVHLGLARCREDRMEVSTARQHYQRGLELAPNHERGNADYAVFRWRYDGQTAGRRQFDTAIERCPESAHVYRRAARVMFENNLHTAAPETLERGIDRLEPGRDGHLDLRIQHARLLAQIGEETQARDAVDRLLETDVGHPAVHFAAAAFHDRYGEETAAKNHLQQAFEARVSAEAPKKPIERVLSRMLRLLCLLDEAGEDEALVRWARYALDQPAVRAEAGTVTQRDVAEIEAYLRDRGIPIPGETTDTVDEDGEGGDDVTDTTGERDEQTADEQVREAVATDTEGVTSPADLVATGEGYRTCEVAPFARAYYRQALEHNPDHLEAHRGLGRLAAEVGEPDEVAIREHFERATAIDPTDLETRRRYGLALAWAGAAADAASQYRQALEDHPADALTNCWFGDLCVDRGDDDLARHHLTRGLTEAAAADEAIGAQPRVYWTARLVELLADAGQDDAVVEWCRRGLALCTETLLPTEAQQTLEQQLAERTGEGASQVAPNRRDGPRHNVYWYAELRGRACNALLEVDGREINWTTNGASFHMSLPLNEYTDPGPVTVSVTILRAVYDTADGETVGGVEDATCSLRIKRYEAGDVAAPETGTVLGSADLEPTAVDRFPTRIEVTFERDEL